MTKQFRGDQNENNRVVNSWEGNEELEMLTILLNVSQEYLYPWSR